MSYLVELWVWSVRQVGERRASRLVSLLTGVDRSTVNHRVIRVRKEEREVHRIAKEVAKEYLRK